MKRITLLILLLAGLLACDNNTTGLQPGDPCTMDRLQVGDVVVCVYPENGLTPEFRCPDQMPHLHQYGDYLVCTPGETPPPALPDSMAQTYSADALPDDEMVGPPDTSTSRFEDTMCHNWERPGHEDARCAGNQGCDFLGIECVSCACELCADGYCLAAVCDGSGIDDCGGGSWQDVGTDAKD